jgi:hypothetical protein
MRLSRFHLATVKEVPADAEIVSHQLMLRAGMLRKLAAGEIGLKEAQAASPNLRRVGGVCPCARSVRWVVEEPASANAHGDGTVHAP